MLYNTTTLKLWVMFKGTQTLMSSYIDCRIKKIWLNQWNIEQIPARKGIIYSFSKYSKQ